MHIVPSFKLLDLLDSTAKELTPQVKTPSPQTVVDFPFSAPTKGKLSLNTLGKN